MQEKVKILGVDEITEYIRFLLESDSLLSSIVVRGEISSFKRHTSGHVYFVLAGKESRINCVLFRGDASRIPSWPRDGDEVLVEGRVSVYGQRGTYQLYVRDIRPLGKGAQARAKEELKKRLQEEGLFEQRFKRPLPAYPMKAAVVTSSTGAAVQDVIKVASHRFPQCEIVVVPCLVQGLESPEEIVRGLRIAGGIEDVEVVLLVRGGGSRDDLNPFDDERVVRAIRSVPVPLITGLGHQIDLTLSDLAADVHAPTPSAAAEMAFPDRMELLRRLEVMEKSASFCLGKRIERLESELARLKENLVSACLRGHLEAGERSAEDALSRLNYAVEARLSEAEGRLAESAASLNALSPLKAFDRGWVTCLDADGHVVTQASDLKVGDELKVQFSDGDAAADVQEITLLPHWLREVKTCSPSLSSGEEEP